MKKSIILLPILLTISINSFSQISFKKGYFIDEHHQKIECYIKDMDWKSNPSGFEYKLSEDSEIKKADIKHLQQFEIYDASKYLRAKVDIDRSSHFINELNTRRNPDFAEELIFLKVLIEGKGSLYQYTEASLIRFFYQTEKQEITPLVYKHYLSEPKNIAKNESYKQQLYTDLICHSLRRNDFDRLRYTNRDLGRLFVRYNECMDSDYRNFSEKKGNNAISLNFRPGLNISNLSIHHNNEPIKRNMQQNFPTKFSYRLGFELEYMMPFQANKWSVIVEPTYRHQKWEDSRETSLTASGVLITTVDYQSIELPIGVRHYFHLNNHSKAFINSLYLVDIPIKSSLHQTRTDGSRYQSMQIITRDNLAFGAGFKFKNQYIVEMRYHTPRHLLGNYIFKNSSYKTYSIILGYTLF